MKKRKEEDRIRSSTYKEEEVGYRGPYKKIYYNRVDKRYYNDREFKDRSRSRDRANVGDIKKKEEELVDKAEDNENKEEDEGEKEENIIEQEEKVGLKKEYTKERNEIKKKEEDLVDKVEEDKKKEEDEKKEDESTKSSKLDSELPFLIKVTPRPQTIREFFEK